MVLKSILDIVVKEEAAFSTSIPSQRMEKVLRRMKIPFSFSVHCDKPLIWPRPLDTTYWIRFQLNREIEHPESAHYISEVIQGEAGLLCIALPELCYRFSYSLRVDV